MEAFRDAMLYVCWPVCILLWTVLAAIGIIEQVVTHRHNIKKLTLRLDSLEKASRRAEKENQKLEKLMELQAQRHRAGKGA